MYNAMIVSLFHQGGEPGMAIVAPSVLNSVKELSPMQLIESNVKMQCHKFVTSGIAQRIAVLEGHVLVAAQDLHHFRCQTWGCGSGSVEMQLGQTGIVLHGVNNGKQGKILVDALGSVSRAKGGMNLASIASINVFSV
jgi:hypothetical protein